MWFLGVIFQARKGTDVYLQDSKPGIETLVIYGSTVNSNVSNDTITAISSFSITIPGSFLPFFPSDSSQ